MASRIGHALTKRLLEEKSPVEVFLNRELIPIVRKMLGVFNQRMFEGEGSPEGVVTASPGAIYQRTDEGGSCFYVKETGTNTPTGWIPK